MQLLKANENRTALADAMKQFLLIIVSLGFANAFTSFSRVGGDGPGAGDTNPFSALTWRNWVLLLCYVSVGTRFLLTNWIYLNDAYGEHAKGRRHIRWDAIGVFLTGVAIGVQSVYVSSRYLRDFFIVFAIILFSDVLASYLSARVNRKLLSANDLSSDTLWIGNNFFFLVVIGFALIWAPDTRTRSEEISARLWYWGLSSLAFANCLVSIIITLNGYFSEGRVLDKLVVAFWKRRNFAEETLLRAENDEQ